MSAGEVGRVLRRGGSGGSHPGQNSERKLSPYVRGATARAAASDRAFARGGAAERRGRNRAGTLADCLHSAAGRLHHCVGRFGEPAVEPATPRTSDGGAEGNG